MRTKFTHYHLFGFLSMSLKPFNRWYRLHGIWYDVAFLPATHARLMEWYTKVCSYSHYFTIALIFRLEYWRLLTPCRESNKKLYGPVSLLDRYDLPYTLSISARSIRWKGFDGLRELLTLDASRAAEGRQKGSFPWPIRFKGYRDASMHRIYRSYAVAMGE